MKTDIHAFRAMFCSDEHQLLEDVTSQMAAAHLKDFDSKPVVNISQKTEPGRTTALNPKTGLPFR